MKQTPVSRTLRPQRLSFGPRVAALMVLLLVLAGGALNAVDRVDTVTLPLQARSSGAFVLNLANPVAVSTVPVDTAASWTAIFGSYSSTLSITLTSPSGSTLSTANGDAVLIPGIGGVGMDYVFEIPAPQPGSWSVQILDNAGTTESRAVFYDYRFDSPIRSALVALDTTFNSTEDVILSAFVDDGSQIVTSGLTVGGRIALVGDRSYVGPAVTFRDDGLGSDAVAGDGLLTAAFNPGRTGEFVAIATFDGVDGSGHPFRRISEVTFRVVAEHARLAGSISDRGTDTNGNGLLEHLDVEVDFDVLAAGDYAIRVTLTSVGGNALYARATGSFGVGSGRSLEARFFAEDVFSALAEDGPWTVSEVILERLDAPEGGPVVVGRGFDLGTTGGYLLTDFERDGILLLDGGTFEGVDTNGNGKFERLDVTLPVALVSPGNYTYSAFLRLPPGSTTETIDSGSQTVYLDSGQQTISLSFDGSAIGSNGLDSPYELQGLLIFGQGESLLRIRVLSIDGLTAAEFEGSGGGGGSCPAIQLVAAKTYNPSRWFPDEEQLTAPAGFVIPAELPVTDGNAGNHRAYFRYALSSQSLLVNCVYQGGSAQAHPDSGQSPLGLAYSKFIGCFPSTTGFPNLATRLPIEIGDVISADYVRINVYNGDSNRGRTEITVDLTPQSCN